MIVCVALDDNNGMLFNKRRQSKDRVLRERLLMECDGARLWMNEYTAKQFDGDIPANVMVDNDFLNKAGEEEYCFVENCPLKEAEAKIKKLIVFKWNRVYPADTRFDISLDGWKLTETEEFVGSSHELITKEVWIHE